MKQVNPVRYIVNTFFKSQTRRLLLGIALATCTACMGAVLLGISGWFITATAFAGLSSTTALLFDVFMPSAAIRFLAIGRTASRYGERLITHDATLGILNQLREKLFSAWAQPEAAKKLFLRPSRILFRLTTDLAALEGLYLRLMVPFSAALITSIVVSIITACYNLWLGLGLLIWLWLNIITVVVWIKKRSVRLSARRAQALEQLRTTTADLASGQTDLMMVNQINTQLHRIGQADQHLSALDNRLNVIENLAGFWISSIQTITLTAMLACCAWLIQLHIITAPQAALLILLAWASAEPIMALRRGALDIGQTVLAARRVAPALQQADEETPAITRPLMAAEGIRLNHVSYQYALSDDQHYQALKDIQLTIHPGEHIAIIGPSGSGKSTLLSLIAKEIALQSGQAALPECVWLTQRNELFQDSLRNNINLTQANISDDALWDALDKAGLATFVQQTKAGLSTQLGEGGLGLSGGQSRRLALARLFIAPIDCWLLDEPTEGIDAQTAQDILQSIHRYAAQKTIVMATHMYRETLIANRLIVLDHGQIVADVKQGTAAFEQIQQQLRQDNFIYQPLG